MTLLLIALPMSACGSSSGDPVAKAATSSAAKGTVHIDMHGTVAAAGQTVTMNGSGDVHTKTVSGAMHFTMLAAGKRIAMEEVQRGTHVYMRSPLFSSTLPAGKTWVVVDLKSTAAKLGLSLKRYAQQDPSDLMAALEKAGTVTKVGDAVVNGVDTTHYRATVNLAKTRSRSSVPVDVWIDRDDLLRRARTSYSATSMQMDFSNYGEHVNVQVPSADDTFDMTSLGG